MSSAKPASAGQPHPKKQNRIRKNESILSTVPVHETPAKRVQSMIGTASGNTFEPIQRFNDSTNHAATA
jgi:hypothetical protein